MAAHQDAAAIFGQTGDQHGEGMALNNLGIALQEVGRHPDAVSLYEEAAAACRETGDEDGEHDALAALRHARAELQASPEPSAS